MSILTGRLRYPIGILCLFCVVFLWVGSGFIVSFLFTQQDYYKPFFLTYFNTCVFTVYFIPYILKFLYRRARGLPDPVLAQQQQQQPPSSATSIDVDNVQPPSSSPSPTSPPSPVAALDSCTSSRTSPAPAPRSNNSHDDVRPLLVHADSIVIDDEDDSAGDGDDALPDMDKSKSGNAAVPEGKMSLVEHARCAAEFCFLWYIANSCNNASYGLTTVSSATILASLSGPFTLLIASRFGADQFTYVKLVAILVCFGGVCLVGLSDSSSSTDTHSSKSLITGDILSIVGAVFYACYITQMKLRIKHESRVDFPLFFGFLGLINMVCLIPVLAVLHYTGVEVFELPGANAIPYMIGNALFGTVLSDYFWMMATLLAGPIVTTLGLSLTTPVAMVGDLVLKGITYSPMYVGGAALIVVGFIGINLPVLANKPAPPPAPTPADVDDS